jgi:hypothetical protein
MKSALRSLSPASQLLALLNLASSAAPVDERIHALCAAGLDWAELADLARDNQVVPFTLRRLEALGYADRLGLAGAPLREQAARIRDQNAGRSARAAHVFAAFGAAGIEAIVLKGFMFAHALYRDAAYKKMNDVDVLVRDQDYARAAEILRTLGFRSYDEFSGEDVGSSKTHHNTTFVSEDLRCIIGLHWRLTSPLGPWKPDMAGVWARRVPVELGEARAFRMAWEDNLLHLCIHLPFFKIGLRELADAYNVVLASGAPFDWDAFDRHVQLAGGEDAVYRLLVLADALVPLGIPAALRAAWTGRTSRFTRRDTDRRVATPDVILRSRSVYVGKIEKNYIVFKKTERYGERAAAYGRFFQMLLWPETDELRRIAGRPELAGVTQTMRARAAAPAKIWNALARDFGHTGLSMMLLLSGMKLARDTARGSWSAGGRRFAELPDFQVLEAVE